jgi:hypothetical protein
MTLRRLWPALLVIGVALMVPFQATNTLALGVACLVGVFLIATPEFLGRDDASDPP